MLHTVLVLAGFVLLIYGANLLIDGASSLALRFKVPNIVIGLTIVAFGTSAPELAVNLVASINQNPDMVLGNVLGSNVFNILVILGITAIIFPLEVRTNTTWIEIPLTILAALVVLVLASDVLLNQQVQNSIMRSEGILCLFFFVIFMVYVGNSMKQGQYDEGIPQKIFTPVKTVFFIVFGLGMLIIGGRLIVIHASEIARVMGISERIISLTVVSIGTSLPELAASVIAARKKNVDMAIGNIVGSNLFNVFLILGLSATTSPIVVKTGAIIDILLNLLASVLLFLFVFTGKGRKIDRPEGFMLLAVYVLYMFYILR